MSLPSSHHVGKLAAVPSETCVLPLKYAIAHIGMAKYVNVNPCELDCVVVHSHSPCRYGLTPELSHRDTFRQQTLSLPEDSG